MDERDELDRIALWLRTRSAELLRQCSARKQSAESMQNATAKELKESANLIRPVDGRTVKAMTVSEAKDCSARDSIIAGRLEVEAASLASWADFLDRIELANPPHTEGGTL
jgi:hypothetical protein